MGFLALVENFLFVSALTIFLGNILAQVLSERHQYLHLQQPSLSLSRKATNDGKKVGTTSPGGVCNNLSNSDIEQSRGSRSPLTYIDAPRPLVFSPLPPPTPPSLLSLWAHPNLAFGKPCDGNKRLRWHVASSSTISALFSLWCLNICTFLPKITSRNTVKWDHLLK